MAARTRNSAAALLAAAAMLTAWAAPAAAEELNAVRELSVAVVAELSGLDGQTLTMASLRKQQAEQIKDRLKQFLRKERPRLSTYRIVWLETVERLENLKASAAANSFDPCEFVTDEAIAKAQAEVRKARDRFEDHCQKASHECEPILKPEEYALVCNARANTEIPAPYRWLELSEACRKHIRRLLRVHEARVKLARKYPQLKAKLSEGWLSEQIEKLLDKKQLAALAGLRSRFKGLQAQKPAGDGKA